MLSQELVEEQRAFQYGGKNLTERGSTLEEYGRNLGFWWIERSVPSIPRLKEEGITAVIDAAIAERGRAVWVDLGCGNGAALRFGRQHVARSYGDPSLLRAVGVDVLPEDDGLKGYLQRRANEYPADLLDSAYSPERIEADAHDVTFPEHADLVTAHGLFLWVRDPLAIVENAAMQTRLGGVLAADYMQRLLYVKEPHGCLYDQGLLWRIVRSPPRGIAVLSRTDYSIVIQRTASDVSLGFSRVSMTRHGGNSHGHSYLYTDASAPSRRDCMR